MTDLDGVGAGRGLASEMIVRTSDKWGAIVQLMPSAAEGAGQPRGSSGVLAGSVRRANLSAVVRSIHLDGACTRSALGDRLGLARSSVGGLVAELAALGLVHEEPSRPDGNPGRPSPLVKPRDDAVVIALEVLVDSVACAVVALGGKIVRLQRRERSRSRLSPDETLRDLRQIVTDVGRTVDHDMSLFGVGVAVAGLVRRGDGVVTTGPNIGWHDVSLRDLLGDVMPFGVTATIGNDGDAGALAECRRGAAIGRNTIVFVSGEVGVGGGVIIDGTPLSGAAGFAGEVGHVPVNPNGVDCSCGSKGCWETEIGEEALLRRAGLATDGGSHAVDQVIERAGHDDVTARRALDEHADWLAWGLASVINLFDPDMVVLGGMLARIHPFVAARLQGHLERLVMDEILAGVTVVPATLGRDAPVLGAAELAWNEVLDDPSSATPKRSALR